MKMKKRISRCFSMLIALLMILVFSAAIVPAQKRIVRTVPLFNEDTSINPHDFNDDYYLSQGVNPKLIAGRRTGTDFLSVFSLSSNPVHRNVRVLVTLPAVDQTGMLCYWYPLGEFNEAAFTEDYYGLEARQIADAHLIYVFPKKDDVNPFSFNNNRQAAMLDNSFNYIYPKGNPLGLRRVVLINFTDKAFKTKEGTLMMFDLGKKNGLALDGTPLLRDKDEIEELIKNGYAAATKANFRGDDPAAEAYVIAPAIDDPTRGVIAPDAFLSTILRDGKPLPGESIFSEQFECLQKTGNWCAVK